MKLQEFINILDQSGIPASDFFKKNGKEIFKTQNLLTALLNLKWSEKLYNKLGILSWIIRIDLGRPHYGGKRYFHLIPIYKHFAIYINSLSNYGDDAIPFKEWESLAKEEIELLKILVKENKLKDFEKDPRFNKIAKKRSKLTKALIKKGYKHLYLPFSMGS